MFKILQEAIPFAVALLVIICLLVMIAPVQASSHIQDAEDIPENVELLCHDEVLQICTVRSCVPTHIDGIFHCVYDNYYWCPLLPAFNPCTNQTCH